jgi:hypothetical protein
LHSPYIFLWGLLQGEKNMDEEPKPTDGAAVVAELRQALDAADRCIELAKREAARVDASLRSQSDGGERAEQVLLDTARKRREQLSALDLWLEVPPSPPSEPPPAVPVPSSPVEASETPVLQAPQLVSQV